jgi:hypothetical protein
MFSLISLSLMKFYDALRIDEKSKRFELKPRIKELLPHKVIHNLLLGSISSSIFIEIVYT